MKPWVVPLSAILLAGPMASCGPNPEVTVGKGSGNEGEARTVCGVITKAGSGTAGNIEVRLLPVNYNPMTGDTIPRFSQANGAGKADSGRKNWNSLKATTDQHGYFEIKNVPFNTYNLVSGMADSSDYTVFTKVIVDSSENRIVDIDTVPEKRTGRIRVAILDSVAALNISLVLVGTGICVPVTHAGDFEISAPAGSLQLVCMRVDGESGALEAIFEYDNVVVRENRTTVLGGADTSGVLKRKIN